MLGVMMAEQMHLVQFGLYIADDEHYDYYVFKCTIAPNMADKDQVFAYNGDGFPVKKDGLYCEGLWLVG